MVYGLQDVVQQRMLIDQSDAADAYKRVVNAKLDAMLGLCETVRCRRQYLLDYFGEASGPCGNCDNCMSPPAQYDGTQVAQKLLSCIYRCEQASGFGFGAQHVIDVLRGQRNEKVQQRGHERVTTFGIGADLTEAQWRAVLRQLVTLRLVTVDHDKFNVLRLTEASREVLKGQRSLTLRQDAAPAQSARRARRGRAGEAATVIGMDSPLAESVFSALRDWRRLVAREHNVPAYTVLHDSSLREIANRMPASTSALAGVQGIGAVKLERYGQAIIDVVQTAGYSQG
jgi:ATP-dependent DNA helicase RecQ